MTPDKRAERSLMQVVVSAAPGGRAMIAEAALSWRLRLADGQLSFSTISRVAPANGKLRRRNDRDA
jgi:hypothetical protein